LCSIVDILCRFKKDKEYPEMTQKGCKAAAARTLMVWVGEVCNRPENLNTQHDRVRQSVFDNFIAADVIMRRNSRFIGDIDLQLLADATEGALFAYNFLAVEAQENNIMNWKVLPKMHLLEHSAYDMARHANPRAVHGYSDEDLVGKIKRIITKCHPLTAGKRCMERYILRVGPYWYKLVGWLRGL
jgi:hypothetical protein